MQTLIAIPICGLHLAFFALLVSFWFQSMKTFDQLVQYQYENLHEQWLADGEPRGMFWKPPVKSKNILNTLIRSNPGFPVLKWLFYTPVWAKADPEALNLLKHGRKFALYWNIGVPIWFAVMLGLFSLLAMISGQ